jgi:hypothetical protein
VEAAAAEPAEIDAANAPTARAAAEVCFAYRPVEPRNRVASSIPVHLLVSPTVVLRVSPLERSEKSEDRRQIASSAHIIWLALPE